MASFHTGIRHISQHARKVVTKQQFGVPVPRGKLAKSPSEVKRIVQELGPECVLKSQVLQGNRLGGTVASGLKGGIQFVQSAGQAEKVAAQMMRGGLKTAQVPGSGAIVEELHVAERIPFENGWYLSITLDRENNTPAVLISKNKGSVANANPDHVFHFSFKDGITAEVMADISRAIDIPHGESEGLETILTCLYDLFKSKDVTKLEIDSLAQLANREFSSLDVKMTVDTASVKRQKDLYALRDPKHEVQEEVEAEKHGLVYVKMDGNIGTVVNGAGLAMATNDVIAYHGGSSANFLDAGGQATKETMMKAFEIVLSDSRVKAILVNIYGGIIRCDMIAESIIGAAAELGPLRVPLVVRLQGTNSAEGLQLIEDANLGLHVESDFGEAAAQAVKLAKGL